MLVAVAAAKITKCVQESLIARPWHCPIHGMHSQVETTSIHFA